MTIWNSETADWYAKKYGDYPTNTLAVDALRLGANSTIVDIGCGTGSALRHAAKQVTNGALIGIDPVPRMLEIAREQTANHPAAERIVFFEGAAEELPVEDAVADFVLAFDSFDHWQDQLEGLSEVRRILNSSGLLVVVKDGGLPDGSEARQTLVEALATTGFRVIEERVVARASVSFTMWVCGYGESGEGR